MKQVTILRQKLPAKEQLLKLVKGHIDNGNFSDPARKFIYFPVDYIQELMKPILDKLDVNYKVTVAWVHILAPGAFHTTHNHADDTVVYYLNTPPNSGNLVFPDRQQEIIPEEDMLVIVPARERHSININKSNKPRIALAFSCIAT